MIRTASARWQGDGPKGNGALTTQSGVFKDQPYSFHTRFENEDGQSGTNPEELIGAAHAGCFAMATAFGLTKAGKPPTELNVSADVDFNKVGEGFQITAIALKLEAKVADIDDAQFQEIANGAKENCPISKALASVPLTLSAKLL